MKKYQDEIKKHIYWNYAATGFLIVNIIAFIILILIFTLPVDILTVKSPINVVPNEYITINEKKYPVVYIGDDLSIEFSYNKKQSYSEQTFRSMLCDDDSLVTFTEYEKNLPLGQHNVIFNGMKIPEKSSTDTLCYVRYLVNYEINRFRVISVPAETERFYVKERTK